MLWVLENFGDLLGEFTRLRIKPYSWLRFIIVEGYKEKSAKGNGTWGQSLEETRCKPPRVLFRGVTQYKLNSSSNKL